jgi:alkylhydroperoxidase/carboxymuconolactone decarboxylase family protein YurZ
MTTDVTRREALQEKFVHIHGHWEPRWLPVLEMDPDFFEAFLVFAAAAKAESVLDARARELILLAVNAQTTTLYEPGIRIHMEGALDAGATPQELMEVLELVSLLGVHSLIMGMPILLEEFADAGKPVELEGDLTPRQAEVKDNFTRRRGYWSDKGRPLLVLDSDYFGAYSDLSATPWEHGTIEPKLKEMIYIAIDAATTHLYESGLQLHIQNAMRHGATAKEIFAVLQLISAHGMNSCTVGGPILRDVLKARGL